MNKIVILVAVLIMGGAVAMIALFPVAENPEEGGEVQTPDASNPVVVIDTTMGKIKVELFAREAPRTVKNFLKYVNDNFYDNTIFHRVIRNFMIQGGGMEPGMVEKKTASPIKNESKVGGLSNRRGTIAMARTSLLDSATAQFYINTKDNPPLDAKADGAGYAVFGRVIQGMNVVDAIGKVATGSRAGANDIPVTDVVIRSIRLER